MGDGRRAAFKFILSILPLSMFFKKDESSFTVSLQFVRKEKRRKKKDEFPS